MSFDALAQDIASTLSGVFGSVFTFERPDEFSGTQTVVIRRDVETVDEQGQISLLDYTARFSRQDLPFVPKRGDTLTRGATTYTIGRRISDNSYFIEFEVTA